MSHQPEDLFSPEDEAEMQQGAIRGMASQGMDIFQQVIDQWKQHPETVDPEQVEIMRHALALHEAWMRQQGIGLPQPDVDI